MNRNIKNYQFKGYKIVRAVKIDEIYNILYDFDNIFKPSLSNRIIDLYGYAEKLLRNAITFYIIEEQVIVGFVAFYTNNKNNKEAYITQIGVKDKSQNRNIGKTLLELCIKISKSNGMKSIKLEVFNNNEKAINFYKKNGFNFFGQASNDSIYMIKHLH
ncbi:GNAT family N-acetyltransferase [Alkaliphilus sp. MSJ-5]|uniref:GNAT family N-acetyltransferase n=1 Tax=Alkaliphilus flagellatus TaxID=2841507 RepID=A0ABS6G2G4_9FIRM|nr:GNAT family N-acetyltransferase [Alkaliphilus flagellatus]MBU5676672.1 GNAT family N-acetyltransferase [Alkaliphilus flagellatus]